MAAFLWLFTWLLYRSVTIFTVTESHPFIVTGAMIVLIVFFISILIQHHFDRRTGFWVPLFFIIALCITVPFAFMGSAFGAKDLESLLISLNENQFGNLIAVGFEGFLPLIGRYALYVALLIASGIILIRFMAGGRPFVFAAGLLLIFVGPLSHHFVSQLRPNENHALIADQIQTLAPTVLSRPAEKKNVILVYLESLERTYRDIPETAVAFQELAAIEDRGLTFTQVSQVHGTGMTIGGLIATQCGVPLVERGIFNPRKKHPKYHDSLPDTSTFYDAQTCLGDILADDDYQISYINGSDLRIYSKGDFLRAHGFERTLGLNDFAGAEEETRVNIWGMNDDLLFERVSSELESLSRSERPFMLATLTIATHGPGGYPDTACDVETYATPMIAAIGCTGDHVAHLVTEVARLGLTDNTIIVVMSDHLAMRNTLYSNLHADNIARHNLVTILGTGAPKTIDRQASMFDVYPTLLELLGYTIANNSGGLGVSLLSDRATLVEQTDVETVTEAIRFNTALKKELWRTITEP